MAKKPAKKASKTRKAPVGRPRARTAAGKTGAVKRAPAARKAARPARKPTAAVGRRREAPAQPAPDLRTPAAVAKGDAKLSPRDIEMFRQMLLQKRAEILGDVSTLHDEALNKNRREASGDLSSMPIHMADLGTDNYELEFTLGLIEGERAILKEIDEALERIRQNTYGFCLATGQPIGKARLRAKPWAKYCYEYTLAQERGRAGRL